MDSFPKRQTGNLHIGRVSIPGARYFVTINTEKRAQILTTEEAQSTVLETMERLQEDGDIENLCATVMPDHVHWLFELGQRLELGRVISKWKRYAPKQLLWQRDFFEHRLRPFEEIERYGRYIFLNPYRADLIATNQVYSGTRFWRPNLFEFTKSLTVEGYPQSEWMNNSELHPIEEFKRLTGQT